MILQGRTATAVVAALAVSLVVNAVGIGFLATRWHGDDGPPGFARTVLLAGRHFPPEIRDRLKAELSTRPEALRRAFRALRDARRVTFDAMRADPLDMARLEAALADERTRTVELQAVGHALLAEAVAASPAEVRAEIKPLRGNRDKRRERGKEDGEAAGGE